MHLYNTEYVVPLVQVDVQYKHEMEVVWYTNESLMRTEASNKLLGVLCVTRVHEDFLIIGPRPELQLFKEPSKLSCLAPPPLGAENDVCAERTSTLTADSLILYYGLLWRLVLSFARLHLVATQRVGRDR